MAEAVRAASSDDVLTKQNYVLPRKDIPAVKLKTLKVCVNVLRSYHSYGLCS